MNLTASFAFFAFLNKAFCALSGTCDSSTVGECKADDVVVSADAVIPKGANSHGRPDEAPIDCVDRHANCQLFATQGECEANPGWMTVYCSLSCNERINSCELRDPKIRCPRHRLDMDQNPAYAPGDMNRMFESLVSSFGQKYNVSVLQTSPYVVVFDNFLSDSEADSIIKAAPAWERSTDTGTANTYGEVGRVISKTRTSSNAWCSRDCERNPDVQRVVARIAEVTRVPSVNFESFQILRYEVGQFYGPHHDNGGPSDALKPAGPRILTFFLYLSDVDEGGETNFPGLKISVKPKKGRAVLWPSTLNQIPDRIDRRTSHEARPVTKGIKYGANSWIHLYNYRVPNLWGCTGTFS